MVRSASAKRPAKPPKRRPAASQRKSRTTGPAKAITRVLKPPTADPSDSRKPAQKAIRNYAAALAYLDAQVNYERKPLKFHQRGMQSLTRIKKLLAAMGNPETAFRSVHIAGTKGKGSTAHMLAEMLRANNLKIGLYTSPHILDVRERVVVDGEMIAEQDFTRLIARIARLTEGFAEADRPTYFEILTALAFQYFKDRKVDIAVVETGLGGRYDATNVLKPTVCGITSLSYDHMQQLGNTLTQIAEEKAGIFKTDVPVVSAPQSPEAKKALKKAAAAVKCPLLFTGDEIPFSYRFESSRVSGPQARIGISTSTSHFDHLVVPLVGEHQAINCGVALGMLDQLRAKGLTLNDEASIAGLSRVRLPGRMEFVCENPRILVDGAHNAASIEALMRAIGQNIPYDSMVVIFGCCQDKDIDGMLKHIQLGADKIVFTSVKSPRSADPAELGRRFSEISGRMVQVAPDLRGALEIAQKVITREDLICITGSFYLVSEAKRLFADHPHRPVTAASPAGVP